MYFIECGRRLAWGYVDQPPLIALVADGATRIGLSLTALRLPSNLAAAALVALTGWFVVRLGGGPFAVAIAMLAVALAPFDFAVGNLLTMNAFEPLLWMLAAVVLVEQLRAPRLLGWAALGVVVGVGILNKWSMLAFAFSFTVGIALTPSRRVLATPGPWLAAAIALTLWAPNLAWQAAHGWPQIVLLHNAARLKDVAPPPPLFIVEQALVMGPASVLLWLPGLVRLLRGARWPGDDAGDDRPLRVLGWAYVVLVALEMALKGKVYYPAPIYPILIAAGAPVVERWASAAVPPSLRRLRTAMVAAITALDLAILPAATPILPLPAYLAYQRLVNLRGVKMERHGEGRLPQQFADQFGWHALVRSIGAVTDRLSPADRRVAAILTADYGQASALQFIGGLEHRDLPPVISGHNMYWIWGPDGDHPVLVAIGVPRATLERAYSKVVQVATYEDPWVLPYSNDLPIFVCRAPRVPLTRFWPELRRYI